MKSQSKIKPSTVEIDVIGSNANVFIFNNIVEVETDDGVIYEYDQYDFIVPNRQGLKELVLSNIDSWIEYANKNNKKELPKPTLEEKVAEHDVKLVTLEDAIDVIFGSGE